MTDPQEVAEAFLLALAEGDEPTASALIDDDIRYVNVGWPAVRGREEMARVFSFFEKPAFGFEVFLHSISAEGDTVLTERTDVLIWGKFRMQFWVWGRFDVVDGRITLWRDSFDHLDLVKSMVRGIAAMALPSLAPRTPTRPSDPPGR